MISVAGIGADGWPGLPESSRQVVHAAEVLMGSARQLAMVPGGAAERVEWPSPLMAALPGLLERYQGKRVCVLASGDPMFFGIGGTLIRMLGPERVHVLPHPSSVSLACARLGWALQDTTVLSVVGRPAEVIRLEVNPGARFLVLSADGGSPARIAALLTSWGFGSARVRVLADLGGQEEQIFSCTASELDTDMPALNIVAVECGEGPAMARVPGLPDESYAHDGQLTKREVRAMTLAALGPVPGELLWDVGAGSGSIGIEWSRAHRSCQAIAIESHPERLTRIAANAAALGVPGLRVVAGRAPAALDGLPAPDAIFIGGGVTREGVLDACWSALRPGGRLVANAVTMESEAAVFAGYQRLGGELTRIAISRATPVGTFTGWKTMMPVTQWSVKK
ncbi:bifunctional cobalt-precorrin-7 (C(5))-methyltransferase/cobalt-precorrin-6B (C(15))-methyltransferase [Longispora albida]|uniref:bifunctional cobalt-precorrin-7 (C(5))-methyltransferase/cobalt-precorrin-6B (C(15))-methyltransferase n=1 Tax=Longispora albida TaxID=203523 RepID=UPI00035E8A63|nr:bifunctional cobalt-precorrin-7 (C(5))-methyltransferase/cobalt-precorrin-6B (C(15))-methyltransferase [Longispora albida]